MQKTLEIPQDLWEALLRPISGDAPCGRFMLYDPLYDRIREARLQEDESLPQGVWQRDLKKADWGKVEALCVDALVTHTKDLQIVSWLLEAWMLRYGVKGAVKGLELMRLLSASFWQDIFPLAQQGDPEYRLSPFVWMNEKLSERMTFFSVTVSQEGLNNALSYGDWKQSQHHEILLQRDPKAAKDFAKTGEVTLAKFSKFQMQTPSSFYKELLKDVDTALLQIRAIETFIMEKEPLFPGILSRLRVGFEALGQFVRDVLSTRNEDMQESEHMDENEISPVLASQADVTAPSPVVARKTSGTIATREEAYQKLVEVADFLSRIEPHSPTPYLVRRAINWGSMSLIDLMQEIVHDQNDYKQILQLLGAQNKTS